MRSYEAARGLFSFMSFLAWTIIIIGGLLAVLGAAQGHELNPYQPEVSTVLALIPGVLLCLLGFGLLAMSQVGRASVDTAEYSQQMLQLSRESLEVSKQSLRQGEEIRSGFESLAKSPKPAPSADYAQGLEKTSPASGQKRKGKESAIGYADRPSASEVSGAGTTAISADAPLPSGSSDLEVSVVRKPA